MKFRVNKPVYGDKFFSGVIRRKFNVIDEDKQSLVIDEEILTAHGGGVVTGKVAKDGPNCYYIILPEHRGLSLHPIGGAYGIKPI